MANTYVLNEWRNPPLARNHFRSRPNETGEGFLDLTNAAVPGEYSFQSHSHIVNSDCKDKHNCLLKQIWGNCKACNQYLIGNLIYIYNSALSFKKMVERWFSFCLLHRIVVKIDLLTEPYCIKQSLILVSEHTIS